MVIIRQLYADNDLQSLILSLTDPRPERMTTRNQDRQIKLAHLRNRFKTLTSTARETPGRHKQRISGQTVQRRLKESLRSARRSYRGPVLTCRQGCSEQEVICNGIVYIGEESFFFWRIPFSSIPIRWSNTNLEASWGTICVLLRRGSWGSLMICAAISFHCKSRLHFCNASLTAQRHRDDILIPYVSLIFANHPDLNVFEQDNTRPFTARNSQNHLNNVGIQIMPWTSLSPDLAPIEHFLDELGRCVKCRAQIPVT